MTNRNKGIKQLIIFVTGCFIVGVLLLITKLSFSIVKSSDSAVAGILLLALAIMFIPSIGYILSHSRK